MNPLDLIKLTALMARSRGRAEVLVGLIDGPVALNHPDLAGVNVREVPAAGRGTCAQVESVACGHGTFVAGILTGKRGSVAPAICPDCTVLVRPIFAETMADSAAMPSATPEDLAIAIRETIAAGARVINLSAALAAPSPGVCRELEGVLDYAARRGVLVVAAAGNQGTLGSTTITRHPWVIPVVACDEHGWPLPESNLGNSIGRCGLRAPGAAVTSLGAAGEVLTLGGYERRGPVRDRDDRALVVGIPEGIRDGSEAQCNASPAIAARYRSSAVIGRVRGLSTPSEPSFKGETRDAAT